MLSLYFSENIAQLKTFSNVVQEAPDNITQEKILLNVVAILLGQHWTDKNLVECCATGSRQQCTGKLLLNIVLILLGQHCTDKNLAQCYPRGPRQHCTGKNPV